MEQGVVYVPVKRYPDVAVTDDLVTTVWVTDTMSTGIQYMFIEDFNQPNANGLLIGQIPEDFNLEPCKSTKQLLLERVEQASNLSPR